MLTNTFAEETMKLLSAILVIAIASGCASMTRSPEAPEEGNHTKTPRGCNALNRSMAGAELKRTETCLALAESKTTTTPERLETLRAEHAGAKARFEKWDAHVKRHGHVHDWKDEDSEHNPGP